VNIQININKTVISYHLFYLPKNNFKEQFYVNLVCSQTTFHFRLPMFALLYCCILLVTIANKYLQTCSRVVSVPWTIFSIWTIPIHIIIFLISMFATYCLFLCSPLFQTSAQPPCTDNTLTFLLNFRTIYFAVSRSIYILRQYSYTTWVTFLRKYREILEFFNMKIIFY